jgi:prenyl protein peptidase
MVPYLFSYYHDPTVRTKEETLKLVILIGPLYFGVAHLHHLFESLRSGQPVLPAMLTTLFQMLYTYIFGVIAIILLLRTGNILSPITSHIICNIQGLPNTDFMIKPGDPYRSGKLSCLYSYKIILLIAHIAGLALFAWFIYPMTSILMPYSLYQTKLLE